MKEELTLKWGSIKGWNGLTDKSVEILRRYFPNGVPLSAMADKPSPERKAILCELIDQIDGEIINDWDDTTMSKDEAKKYVMGYDAK